MATDSINFVTLLLGSGAIVTIVVTVATLFYNWRQGVHQQDFQARQNGKDYYLNIFAHICILWELADSYARAMCEPGEITESFTFKTHELVRRKASEIFNEFKNSYDTFIKFYIKNKAEGKEMFISRSLETCLIDFWKLAKEFNSDVTKMNVKERTALISKFKMSYNKCRQNMQKSFGLS